MTDTAMTPTTADLVIDALNDMGFPNAGFAHANDWGGFDMPDAPDNGGDHGPGTIRLADDDGLLLIHHLTHNGVLLSTATFTAHHPTAIAAFITYSF